MTDKETDVLREIAEQAYKCAWETDLEGVLVHGDHNHMWLRQLLNKLHRVRTAAQRPETATGEGNAK